MLVALATACLLAPAWGLPDRREEVQAGIGRAKFLYQSDFELGTVRITEGGTYHVMEDIVFNPRADPEHPNADGSYHAPPSENDYYPGSDYTPGGFRLGFFAAISIEAHGVVLRLHGHEIRQHQEHYIQQRFYAAIELGNAPFVNGQGPASFGELMSSANIAIENGVLGLSSHIGIHGNDVDGLIVKDLVIKDFEVAGIQVNFFNNVHIENCEIGPSLRNVPLMGFYSHARFLLTNVRNMANGDTLDELTIRFTDREDTYTVSDIAQRLETAMDLFFEQVALGGVADESLRAAPENYQLYQEAVDLFSNKEGLPDGSAIYGILLNSIGVAVNWFGDSDGTSVGCVITDVHIHDLNLKVNEIIGYQQTDTGSLSKGPHGDLLEFGLILDTGKDSLNSDYLDFPLGYRGNLLADAQIALGMHGEDNEAQKSGTSVSSETIRWATQGDALPGIFVCNGDVMDHTDKGAIGIRVDNSEDIRIEGVTIEYIRNWGDLGKSICLTENGTVYNAQSATPTRADGNKYYEGSASRGIAIVNTQAVFMEDVTITHIAASTGKSLGIDVMGVSDVTFGTGITISDILAGQCLTHSDLMQIEDDYLPNEQPYACGMMADEDSFIQGEDNLDISNIDGPNTC